MPKYFLNNSQTTLKKVKISPKNTTPTNKGHGSQGGKNQKPINQGKESHSKQGDPQGRENSPLGNNKSFDIIILLVGNSPLISFDFNLFLIKKSTDRDFLSKNKENF